MSRKRIQAVAFDMDGLMFNTEELYPIVCQDLVERRNHQFDPELLNHMMGRPARTAFQVMIDWHGLTDTVATLAAESTDVFSRLLDERLQTMPGLLELLHGLETQATPKAVTTSSERHFCQRMLQRFDLQSRFTFLLCAEDVTEGKPHPEIYLKAAAQHGIDPEAMLVLEDSQNGCRAAVAAGAYVVAVPGGHSRHHDFQGAQFVADTLADVRLYELLQL